MVATCVVGTGIGGLAGGTPKYAITGFVFSLFLVAPMAWWLYKQGRLNGANRPSNIFYENSCTPEDIARIKALDEIESLGNTMKS